MKIDQFAEQILYYLAVRLRGDVYNIHVAIGKLNPGNP